MNFYILLLISINILLAQNVPPLPQKLGRYTIRGSRVVRKPQSIKHITIKSHIVNGVSHYHCVDRDFTNYGEALQYCQLLYRCEAEKRHQASFNRKPLSVKCRNAISRISRSLSRKSQKKTTTNLPIRRNSTSNSNQSLVRNVIGNSLIEFYPDKKINVKSFSYMTWNKVWHSCNYKCYFSQNYGQFKNLIMTEINTYRLNHGVRQLISSSYLQDIAQKYANDYANKQKLNVNPYATYGVLHASVQITSASSIIRSFYDTKRKYSYFLNKPMSRVALCFTQIIWASTEKFGIGVQHHNTNLYIVLLFHPNGNIKGKFKKNIFHRIR
uniref:CAP domain-containing protein (inferred by orthology to a zebrafish protein) n=1 Tax=Strongyloides venezuelensis TaxID=75913 RepID=A0A0K0FD16_STRVS